MSAFCTFDEAVQYANENKSKGATIIKKSNNKNRLTQKKKDNSRKKELMTRGAWYQKYQRIVNQWVLHVRDCDEPCATCGTESESIKYDAGHYIAVGHNMDLRFELTNIHKQCSVKCNQFGRGMPVEYGEFINNKYGDGQYNWLNTKFLCYKPHLTLKELFPTWQDIELEIKRFRKLIRDAGLTPKV
jgi:hypothetical protein